jgi:hypothetical protein
MAKQPQRDDNKSKKSNGEHPPAPKTPKPVIPNMSLDEPVEAEPLEVEEVLDDDFPIVEAAPASDVAPTVLPDDELIVEAGPASEVVEAMPASDVVEAAPVEAMPLTPEPSAAEEVLEAEAEEVTGSSAVLAEPEVVSDSAHAAAAPVETMPHTPESSAGEEILVAEAEEVTGSSAVLAEPEVANEAAQAEGGPAGAVPSPLVEAAPAFPAASTPIDVPAEHPTQASNLSLEEAAAAEIAQATPASDVNAGDVVFEEPAGISTPASEVGVAHETIASAPPSEVAAAEELVEKAGSSSEVAAVEEMIEKASPESKVGAREEFIEEPAPASEVAAAEEIVEEAAPASEVAATEEIVEEAAPASEVAATEEIVEEAASASEVAAGEEIEEAAPASEVKAEGVLFEETIDEAAPASEAKSAEVLEEPIEAAEEVSSATRKVEAVLDNEAAAEVPSAAEWMEEPMAEEAVLDADEAEAVEAGSSSVLSDIAVDEGSAVKKPASAAGKTAEFDKTAGFGLSPSSSAAERMAGDLLIGEEEDAGQKSPISGIEKGAGAPESGVDLEGEGAAKAPSVEFDELLDEGEAKPAKKRKPATKANDDSTEVDTDLVEEASRDEETISAKKASKKVKKDGDDIDLEDYLGEAKETFDEADAAEAFAAGEASKTEAAEAFDEEMEAAEAEEDEDEKPKKKSRAAIEEEEAEEDEEVSAKKKRKDNKDRATPAPAAAPTSTFVRVFVGMFLATILLAGAGAAGWYFAPDQLTALAKMSPNVKPDPKPKVPVPSNLDRAHEAMDQGKYQDAVDLLKDAAEPGELATRGEARWFAYFTQLGMNPPDAKNPKVKEAIDDLQKGKNEALLAQIKSTLAQTSLQEDLRQAILDKGEFAKKLDESNAAKEIAEKRLESAKQVLVSGNFIDKDENFDGAILQKVLKGLSADRLLLTGVNEVLKDAKIKNSGAEGVKEVLKLKKDADDSLAAVNKVLQDENTKGKGDKGVLEIVDSRNKMAKDRDDLLNTITAAFKELVAGRIVKDGADPRKEIVAGTRLARQKAESPLAIPLAQLGMSLGGIGSEVTKMVGQSFGLAKVFAELGYFRAREPFIQTPEQKMDNYISLLQDRKRNNPKELADINREAEWVRSPEAKASVESRAKARYVQGLALRNQENFVAARAAFFETLKMIAPPVKAGAWSELARNSQRELVNPRAYYLPRIDRFQEEGNLKAALDEAAVALRAMPKEAILLARRGLIRCEMVRGKGPKAAEAAQKAIRADAESAGKDQKLAAESAYIVGLLEEELGNWAAAEKQYRQAIKMSPAVDDSAGRYRIALARLLLREPEAAPAAPAPAPGDEDKKKDKVGALSAPQERTLLLHAWTPVVLSAIMAQAQPLDEVEDKETLARLNESLKLAEELIASKNPKIKGQGYLLKGSALSKLGKRTEGLKEYSQGLKLIYPGLETKEMTELIQDHPAFQQPDVSTTPNPLMAERHFGEGIHYYWSKEYLQAEAQFRQAVKYYDKDARYYYYLGLAQLQQKTKSKRDAAIYSFEQGALLEAKMASINPDSVREINAGLERIQGELRQYLNTFRYKAKSAEPEAK